eukprot:TRINITY_DN36259_c0_g1_i1.p1 TRINITY_DN36259_c0_g1~~TRINITY_DN36259_c0_g1_i1.p1  ORF type:complete len:200 (+),score=44.61 TRINITY_DN36259_c0_g1_i1:76-600(+)
MLHFILTCALLLINVPAVVSQCSMFGAFRRPVPQPGIRDLCPLHMDNACCLEAEARAAFSSPYVPFNATEKCSQVVRQTLCHVCSPVQSSFFSSGRVRLCLSQCIVMYKWCGNAMLAEPNDPVHANDIAAYTRPIREAFTDGTAFCNWLGYNVTADPSNAIQPSCYRQLESLSV